MSEQHDNTNRGALWSAKGFAGRLNVAGSDMFVLMVATQAKSEAAPTYKAVIRDGDREVVVPVWRNKKPDSKAAGHFEYAEHVVNIFLNEKTESANAPILRLSALPKEARPAAVAQQPEDDLPF